MQNARNVSSMLKLHVLNVQLQIQVNAKYVLQIFQFHLLLNNVLKNARMDISVKMVNANYVSRTVANVLTTLLVKYVIKDSLIIKINVCNNVQKVLRKKMELALNAQKTV
jgi:hypothetical protein